MVSIGVIFPPHLAPEELFPLARAADGTVDELWLWEDCFAESGMATAVATLGATSQVKVGVGLFPVPLRNVALLAMELATVARLHPGRFLPGIGHGVLSWMAQAGVRAPSPLTLLREYGTALRALLDGEEVSVDGDYVRLDGVRLAWPPDVRLPVFVGAEGPKTMAVAGVVGDGIVFTGTTTPERVRAGLEIANDARAHAGVTSPLENVAYLHVLPGTSGAALHDRIDALVDAGIEHVAVLAELADGPAEINAAPAPDVLRLIEVLAHR